MKTIINILITALLVVIIGSLLPGTTIDNYWTAIYVAITIGILNVFVRPLLFILTLPVTILTFGLFIFILNAIIISLADYFIDGFSVKSIWSALVFSICLSIFKAILFKFIKENEKK